MPFEYGKNAVHKTCLLWYNQNMKNNVEQSKTQNDLILFAERANAMIESKYILAAKKISSLLKGIVSISYLMDTVSHCLKNFSYANEFARNRKLVPDGSQVKSKLTLPNDKTRLFTFVFCLLAEIDSGERDLTKFLNEYFDAPSLNDSYQSFCADVIIPFKKAGESIIKEVTLTLKMRLLWSKGWRFLMLNQFMLHQVSMTLFFRFCQKL